MVVLPNRGAELRAVGSSVLAQGTEVQGTNEAVVGHHQVILSLQRPSGGNDMDRVVRGATVQNVEMDTGQNRDLLHSRIRSCVGTAPRLDS